MYFILNKIIRFVSNNKQMKTYMTKYRITYWTQRNDESTDVEIIIEALNEVDAMKQFLDKRLVYRKIESIEELV
jgi:hypothetical protein